MSELKNILKPLFDQSRYIRPSGSEYFLPTSLNIIKSPFVTGALCATFAQVASGGDLSNSVLTLFGLAFTLYNKGIDNNDFDQLKPHGKIKIIDKKPDLYSPKTDIGIMKIARIKSYKAAFWSALYSLGPVLGAHEALTSKENLSLLQGFQPIFLGLACSELMRSIRFRMIADGKWVVLGEPPRKDEPLYRPQLKNS